jgi:hypothetical protein
MPALTNILNYYRTQSELSSPRKYAHLYDGLPTDVRDLCGIIQGFLLHQFWIIREPHYGLMAADLKADDRDLNAEINLRSVEQKYERLLALDGRPLTEPRPPQLRLVGNCRDYALLLTSMLRHQGVPARVRSGVARYFYRGQVRMEDHFICEWWNEAEKRWQRTDPQIDAVQRKVLGMTLDPADLPSDQFLDSVESYDALQEGRVPPEKIGIFDYNGWPYVRYKLVSDLAGLNRVEVLAWEGWGVCRTFETDAISEADQALLDEIIAAVRGMDSDPAQFERMRTLFTSEPGLQFPLDYQPHYFELPPFK